MTPMSRRHPTDLSVAHKALVAGVGMIAFAKPGASDAYPAMGAAATRTALANAGLDHADVQQAYVG